MHTMITAESIREFAGRKWARIAEENQRYWADQYAKYGASATVRAAEQLWGHMKAIQPGWPSEAERADDLADHIRLKSLIDRASDGLATI